MATAGNDEAPNSAALGATGSLVRRLDDMLPCTDDGSISELKDYIHSISHKLKKLSEVQDPPLTVNYWMKHARELSYDIEAYLDDLEAQREDNLSVSDAKKEDSPDDSDAKMEDNPDDSDANMEDFTDDSDDETEYSVDDSHAQMEDNPDDADDEAEDSVDNSDGSNRSSGFKISGFRTRAKGMIDRYDWFSLDSVLSCPTATTTIASPRPSRDVVLVGMGNQITELISLLRPKDETDNQLKIVSILGDEGIGKSTLIQEIWRESFKEKEIWHELESEVNIKRAFVLMGKKPDVRMILRSILSQVSEQEPAKDSEVTKLIWDIRKHLEQKRYFIIVDDVRSLSVWDVVSRAFPRSSFGSRIITTTSDKEVALACCSYVLEHNYIMKPLSVDDCKELFIRTVGFRTVNLQLSKQVIDEIKRKCGGLPLAIIWTAILVASKLETEQGLSWSEKEQNLDSEVKKFLDENLRTCSAAVEILNKLLKLCYSSLPYYLKTCLLYLSVYPENYFFLKEDLVKLWIAEDFICKSEKHKVEAAGRYFNVLVSLGLIQRMNINNGNKQHHQGEVHVVTHEGEDPLRLRVPYVVHPMVFDFITCKSIEDNFITIIDHSQSVVVLKDKTHRLSLQFGSATYATTPAGLSQVRTLSFVGLLGRMPSLVEFKIVRVMILDLWADNEDMIFSLTKICKLLLLKYLQVSCNVTVELPEKLGCLKLLETLEINSRVKAVPSDILNHSSLTYARLDGKTYLERVPQDVAHTSSHMTSLITEVDLDPTLVEPVNEKDQVPVISGTRDYYTTEKTIDLDKMPVKDMNEHADCEIRQVSDVTQDDSPPLQKSVRRIFEMKNLVGEDTNFKLEDLEKITDNFSEELKVGSDGYGNVYRFAATLHAEAAAVVDQLAEVAKLAEAGDAFGAREILVRLNYQLPAVPKAGTPLLRSAFYFKEALRVALSPSGKDPAPAVSTPNDVVLKLEAYKAFSVFSPVLQFTHLTCLQAVLDELGGASRVHMLDLDIGTGEQWAPLMLELAKRGPAATLKVTALVSSASHHPLELNLIHENLSGFARKLGVLLQCAMFNIDTLDPAELVAITNGDAVAVHLPVGSAHMAAMPAILHLVKRLGAKVVVSVDHGCDRTELPFAAHLFQSFQSCVSLLDSIDAMGADAEAVARIERFLVQPDVELRVVSRHRAAAMDKPPLPWRTVFASAGFVPVQASTFAESQAETMLKRIALLGFRVEKRGGALCLYWQRGELVSVSSWRC